MILHIEIGSGLVLVLQMKRGPDATFCFAKAVERYFLRCDIGLTERIQDEGELWAAIDELGDRASYYVLESFVDGDVYHVDSIVYERELRMAVGSRYGTPPFDVSHGGGVFTSALLERGTAEERELLELNRRVLTSLGLVRGVSHSEYIRSRDGQWVFLETSARVGGAHIAELVEAATGVNMWREWARVEIAGGETAYDVRAARSEYAALLVSLARQEWPDLRAYDDSEIAWRLSKRHHAGLVVAAAAHARVESLLAAYMPRFREDFFASMPAAEEATE